MPRRSRKAKSSAGVAGMADILPSGGYCAEVRLGCKAARRVFAIGSPLDGLGGRRLSGCGCSSGVEHDLAKVGVEGSNPFARSNFRRCPSTGRLPMPIDRLALSRTIAGGASSHWRMAGGVDRAAANRGASDPHRRRAARVSAVSSGADRASPHRARKSRQRVSPRRASEIRRDQADVVVRRRRRPAGTVRPRASRPIVRRQLGSISTWSGSH